MSYLLGQKIDKQWICWWTWICIRSRLWKEEYMMHCRSDNGKTYNRGQKESKQLVRRQLWIGHAVHYIFHLIQIQKLLKNLARLNTLICLKVSQSLNWQVVKFYLKEEKCIILNTSKNLHNVY
jgi:hypothetical protein